MKLTQFALSSVIVLLAVAAYLTLKSDFDSRLAGQNALNEKMVARLEEMSKKQAQPLPQPAPPAAVPVVAALPAAAAPAVAALPPRDPAGAALPGASGAASPPLAAANDPRMLEDERAVLNLGSADRVATDSLTLPAALDGQALTRVQQRIVALPAIARVKLFAEKEGMIVLNSGSNVGLRAGSQYSLRRKSAVIGKIRISDTVNPTECVADLVPGSMPVGMLPAVDDDVIQFEE